jgi:hypothetical protein
VTWALANAMDLAAAALLAFAAWHANGILGVYLQVPWQSTKVGRVLFSKALMIAAVLDLALVAIILVLLGLGSPVWFEILRLVAFAGVAFTLWWQRNLFRQIVRESAPPKETP